MSKIFANFVGENINKNIIYYNMKKISIDSISWAAFLEMGARMENSPTIL